VGPRRQQFINLSRRFQCAAEIENHSSALTLEWQNASFSTGQVTGTGEWDFPAGRSQPSGIWLQNSDLATFRYV